MFLIAYYVEQSLIIMLFVVMLICISCCHILAPITTGILEVQWFKSMPAVIVP